MRLGRCAGPLHGHWPSCGILLLKFRIQQPLLPIEAAAFCRRGHFQCAKLMRHHLPTTKFTFLQYISGYPTNPEEYLIAGQLN